MSEQPKGGAPKKGSAKKGSAKKTTAKKAPAKKPVPEKTASPRKTASQRTTASKTTAPRVSKQATKKAAAPVQDADEAQAKDEQAKDEKDEKGGQPTGGLLDVAAGAAGAAVHLAGMPAAAARKVLDAKGGLPAYIGAGALAVTGVVQWPAAVVGSAGYAALRKWGRQLPEPIRTLTGSAPEQRVGDEDAPA